jgi:hypothetical protein
MKISKLIGALGIGVIAVLAIACGSDNTSSDSTATAAPGGVTPVSQLEESLALWNSVEHQNYDFVTNWQCFCLPEYRASVDLSVRGGEITSGEYSSNSELTTPVDLTRYETIDGLFDLIADAIEQDAHNIQVSYNLEQGYPESAFIDYSEMIADEERGFVITKVTTDS